MDYSTLLHSDDSNLKETLEAQNEAVVLSELFQRLNHVQRTAFDLYRRGLNVIPLPRPDMVRAKCAAFGGDPNKKPPFILAPFFTARLHVCGPECKRKHPAGCLPENQTIMALFERANIGVVMGRLSGNLFAIDCDTQTAFKTIGSELAKRNMPYWAIRSARGGSYFMRLAEGEAANMNAGECTISDIEIIGNHKFSVFPPSIHPSGVIYEWVTPEPYYCMPEYEGPPVVSVIDMSWLGVRLALEVGKKFTPPDLYGLPAECGALSRKNREFLAYGALEGERNNSMWAAACDLAGNQIDYDIAHRLLLEAGARCTPHYSDKDASQKLRDAYRRNLEPARKSTTPKPKPHETALAFAQAHDWRTDGRKAQVDRAVFLACCERSRRDGSKIFRASEREIAELANVTAKTAHAALIRLCQYDSPLLKQANPDPDTRASCFEFTNQVLPCLNLPHYLLQGRYSGVNSDTHNKQATQDVFFRLGRVAFRVWQHLCNDAEQSISAIARATSQSRSSVSQALKRLVQYGLVDYSQAEGIFVGNAHTDDSLERIAAVLGSLGHTDKRRRSHTAERERRVNYLVAKNIARWKR